MASVPAKVTEEQVSFYGTRVNKSVADAAQALIDEGKISADTTYEITSGKNKGQIGNYTVEISKKTLDEMGASDRASDLGTVDEDGALQYPFTNLEAKSFEAAVTLVGSETNVLDLFNRSFNMARRQVVRMNVLSKLEGPQKAINKIVEQLEELGFTPEAAKAKAAELSASVSE